MKFPKYSPKFAPKVAPKFSPKFPVLSWQEEKSSPQISPHFSHRRFQSSNRIPNQISPKISQTHFCRLGSPLANSMKFGALRSEVVRNSCSFVVFMPIVASMVRKALLWCFHRKALRGMFDTKDGRAPTTKMGEHHPPLRSPVLLLNLSSGDLSGTESAILNRESSDSESYDSSRAISGSL